MFAEAWRGTGTHGRRGRLHGRCSTFDNSASICAAGVALSVPAKMSAEAWRRTCTHGCRFRQLRLDLPGRRGIFSTCKDVWRQTGTHGRRGLLRGRCGTFDNSGSICVAGVALSVPAKVFAEAWRRRVPMDAAAFCVTLTTQPRFAWQGWRFQYLHRCLRKLGNKRVPMDAAAFCVAGVALLTSQPQPRFAWRELLSSTTGGDQSQLFIERFAWEGRISYCTNASAVFI